MTYEETYSSIGAALPFGQENQDNPVLSGIRVSSRSLPVAQSENIDDMTDERATVRVERSRVVGAVIRYVTSNWEPGSATGRLSIHESRVSRHGGNEADDLDLEEASEVEIHDAIRRAEIRRAAYALPARRTDVVHESGDAKGQPLHCVAPRRMVAYTVHGKPTRRFNGGASGKRLWRLEFGRCWKQIPKECQAKLEEAVALAGERTELGNNLAVARSDVERLRGSSKKKAAALRAEAAARLRHLEALDHKSSRQLVEMVGSAAHRYGLRRLEQIIAASPAVETALFPEKF